MKIRIEFQADYGANGQRYLRGDIAMIDKRLARALTQRGVARPSSGTITGSTVGDKNRRIDDKKARRSRTRAMQRKVVVPETPEPPADADPEIVPNADPEIVTPVVTDPDPDPDVDEAEARKNRAVAYVAKVRRMNRGQLRNECRIAGLPQEGTKDELMKRIFIKMGPHFPEAE